MGVDTYRDDLPNDVLTEVMKGAEPEVVMPPGWGPSDDSEDDYNPSTKHSEKVKRRKQVDSSELSEEDAKETAKVRKRSKTVSKRRKIEKKANQACSEAVHTCLLCRGRVSKYNSGCTDGGRLFLVSNVGEARYHYAECYYKKGKFWDICQPGQGNIRSGDKRKVRDEFGKEITYSCQTCRRAPSEMGYKEYGIHEVLCHGRLEELLEKDGEILGFKEVLEKLDKREK